MTLSNDTIMDPSLRRRGARFFAVALLGATGLSLGCSSDGVDLGGGVRTQDLQRGTRCADTTRIDEDVLVTNQGELEALEGCEEIRGNLRILMFAGADLGPLHALRDVQVRLELGSSQAAALPVDDPRFEERAREIEESEADVRGTWLTSLAGLESLEHVGELTVQDTGITDLRELSGLRSIGGETGGAGTLYLYRNPALVDLAGLQNANGITQLNIYISPALQSLTGLSLGQFVSSVTLTDTPQLTDLDALSTLTEVEFFSLERVGMTDLEALSGLSIALDGLFVYNSPALVDASALRNVTQTASLLFSDNPVLKVLPSFESYTNVPDLVTIERNAELEAIELSSPFAFSSGFNAGGRFRSFGTKLIVINDNPKLESVTFGASQSDELGFRGVQLLGLERNPSLTRLSFGSLRRAGALVINDNPALSDVSIGELGTVDTLELTGNPSLDTGVFDTVSTFERIESAEPTEVPSY